MASDDNTKKNKPMIKALIIDDETMALELLLVSLEAYGFLVNTASSGSAGIEQALAMVPDVIILDIRMPGMSGWETFENLKQHPETRNIPVIFLTAFSNARDIERARNAGALLFLTKPIDPQLLAERVCNALTHKDQDLTARQQYFDNYSNGAIWKPPTS